MLQVVVKSAKAGDDEDDIMKKTIQRTEAKSEALRVYLAALLEEERTALRSPNHSSPLRTGCCRRALPCLLQRVLIWA